MHNGNFHTVFRKDGSRDIKRNFQLLLEFELRFELQFRRYG